METVDIRGYENRPFDKRAAADLEAMLADARGGGLQALLSVGLPQLGAADGAVQAQDKFLHGGGLQPGGGRKTGCHVGGAPRHLGA